MHALLPIHNKGTSRWFYFVGSRLCPLVGGFMGGAFFKLYYESEFTVWVVISSACAIALRFVVWCKLAHLYRAPSAEVIPQGEDTQATAARAAATYTATGSIPIIEKRTYQQ